jgi:exoribonuclease R
VVRAQGDAAAAMADGLRRLRAELGIAERFSEPVVAAAKASAAAPRNAGPRVDRTDLAFLTLDPAGATDLDQAFAIEWPGGDADVVLRYAIADVGSFVEPGDALDVEAWTRGVTVYLPDGRAPLYPAELSEGAASLLPDGDRPAVVFVVATSVDGVAVLQGVERAMVRSRAQLAYETVTREQLPAGFGELSRRVSAAETARGAARVEFPEQQIVPDGDGTYALRFRPRSWSEQEGAALSLATNLAVADAMLAAGTGLFRVMADVDARQERRLRHTATAFGLAWPADVPLAAYERGLDPAEPRAAAFLLAVRRAAGGASYARYDGRTRPWHSAVAATYAHATAPLRRLQDRYVVEAALALANGAPVPDAVGAAFAELPEAMSEGEQRANRAERAAVDLAEAVVLAGCEGSTFTAVVTDEDDRGARIQLCEPAVVGRVPARHVDPGDEIRVRLVAADPATRTLEFERLS